MEKPKTKKEALPKARTGSSTQFNPATAIRTPGSKGKPKKKEVEKYGNIDNEGSEREAVLR